MKRIAAVQNEKHSFHLIQNEKVLVHSEIFDILLFFPENLMQILQWGGEMIKEVFLFLLRRQNIFWPSVDLKLKWRNFVEESENQIYS